MEDVGGRSVAYVNRMAIVLTLVRMAMKQSARVGPNQEVDSIAAEGVNFTNGYAANGTCAPSRAALMSGRYGTYWSN